MENFKAKLNEFIKGNPIDLAMLVMAAVAAVIMLFRSPFGSVPNLVTTLACIGLAAVVFLRMTENTVAMTGIYCLYCLRYVLYLLIRIWNVLFHHYSFYGLMTLLVYLVAIASAICYAAMTFNKVPAAQERNVNLAFPILLGIMIVYALTTMLSGGGLFYLSQLCFFGVYGILKFVKKA